MSKVRVYMVAKQLGMDNKSLVALFQSLGVNEVRNHMSAVAPEQVERIKRHLAKQTEEKVVEEHVRPSRGGAGVIIRRGKRRTAESTPRASASDTEKASAAQREAARPAEPERRQRQPAAAPRAAAPAVAPPAEATATPPAAEASNQAPAVAPAQERPAAAEAPAPAQSAAKPQAAPAADAEASRAPAKPAEPAPAASAAPSPERPAAATHAPEPQRPVQAPAKVSQAAPERPAPSAPQVAPSRPAAPQRQVARPAPERAAAKPAVRPAPVAAKAARPAAPVRPTTSAPKTGIDVWEGRPGVPMPQPPRGVPRRVQYDAKMGGGGRRGPMGMGGRMRGPRRGIGSLSQRRSGAGSVTQERSAHKKVVKIEGDISLQNLAAKMGVKAAEVLMKLLGLGVTGININSTLDADTAKIVGEEFGWTVEDVAVSEDEAIAAAQGGEAEEDAGALESRPPVVTVMGHVDHGKTSLLDRIRRASVATGEAGGITQHIGAYSVQTAKGRLTFLDTPGHAAFTQMRARGAKITDIVILVVAADDGVMPQTKEAISHARDAGCPIVVAVNKVDKPEAQPERVRRELSEHGLVPEEWGGDTLFCEVSALAGQGIEELLDAVLLQAEMLDLRASPSRHARGTVIEAKLDRGRGPVATVLVTDGTLSKGDGLLVGGNWGRVRAMLDENGRNVTKAGPSTPVAVIGLSDVPSAGDIVDAVSDAKKAQQIAEQRREKMAERTRGTTAKVSLEELARRMSQSDQKELKVIIKADVQGSVEALNAALERLSTEKVKVTVVHSGVGGITEGDVNLAVAARALIIGFNVRPAGKASSLAQKEGIEIREYAVIYDVIDDVTKTMEGLLAPKLVEEPIGEAEVRKIFKVSKAGVVAGCMVTSGVVRRNSMVRLLRDSEIIWEGKLDSLKRFKDDAKEVREGFDCGISFHGYNNLQEGDVISAYELKEVRPTL